MAARLGLTVPPLGMDVRAACDSARRCEELGYTDCWSAETSGPDGFSVASAVGVSTEKLRIGCAVTPVYSRPPALVAMSALAAQQASRGRFCLGLGASSPVIVEGWMGQSLDRPLARIRETVEVVRSALAGEKVGFDGSTVRVKGFRLETQPEKPIPIFIAALGPKMLELANEIADGVALYLASEEGVTLAAKSCPGLDIVERVMCCPDEDVDTVREAARWFLTPYVAVPAYNRFIARQGFESEARAVADAWAQGERDRAREAISDRLIDALVIMGPAEACKERLESFRDAGLGTPILGLFSVSESPDAIAKAIERMAPV
jgi:probable F420-dependent oxidoreductase